MAVPPGAPSGDPPRAVSVRLIASDLDGTLLRSDRTVSDRTRAALRCVREAGIVVVLATARPPYTTRLIARDAGVGGLAICSNGALIYDLDRDVVVRQTPLLAKAARRLVAALRLALPGVCFACVQGTAFAAEPDYVASARTQDHGRLLETVQLGDALDLLTTTTTKLIVRHVNHGPDELVAIVRELDVDGLEITHSNAPFVEVFATGVTKAWALASLCADLGIEAQEVVAFGDAPNDIALLRWAGHGVAVANAHPSVIDEVDEVTRSNDEDGVAIVLERILYEINEVCLPS
ncbi:MAG: HAD family hydrolase [Thermomicrobiales bacterium]